MFHVSAFPERSLNRLVLVAILYLHMFLITMHEIDTAAEVYLEPFQTYMRFFATIVKSFWLLTQVKAPSQDSDMVLNTLSATEI